MEPQLNSREAPTLTWVTGIGILFFLYILTVENIGHFHHVHLNHGLSICESVQQKVTQVGSISPPPNRANVFFHHFFLYLTFVTTLEKSGFFIYRL